MSMSSVVRGWTTFAISRSLGSQALPFINSVSRTSCCCCHRHVFHQGLERTRARNFSTDALTSTSYKIIHVAEHVFEGIHHYTHLPWWAVIACSTIFLRSLLTLPLAVYQNKIIAKMELLFPTLKEYQEAVQHNIIVKARRAGMTHTEANKWVMKEARKVSRQLFSQEGCSPYKVAILPWVQLPLWIALSFALRDMSGFFPNLTPINPQVTSLLASEGTLWFQDLTTPDPYCILPIVLAATNFMNIELHALRRQSPGRFQRVMTNTFRVLTVGMVVVGSQMPAAMTLYWSVSSSYGLVQNVLFKYPKVRRKLAIPKTSSESKHPFRDLVDIVQMKAKGFIELQRKRR